MKDHKIGVNATDNVDSKPSALEKDSADDAARDAAELKKLTTELEDLRQSLVRHQADFANYRKRAEKENKEAGQRATARVIEGLIPVIDGFEHALAAHREAEYENYRKGFELIYKQLLDNLARLGAQRLDPLGQPFDPHLHQAMDRVETTEHPDGTILTVYQPAYLYHGRVLRPAMVRVAVHPGGASNETVN
jgi:molecular chaperone GrpE